MPFDRAAAPAQRVLQWSAVVLGVSIPVSTALDNVLLSLVVLTWGLTGQFRVTFEIINRIRYLQISMLLFALLAIGMVYGETRLQTAYTTWSKYADLLCIPLFAMAFREPATRARALHAFAITMVIVIVLSYLIRFGWIPHLPFLTGTAATPTVFKLKITHSLFVAFAAFLFVWLGSTCSDRRLQWVWYGLALFAALNVLLLVQGATGYLTLGVLVLLLGYERLGKRGFGFSLLALLAVAAVLLAAPTPFRERVQLIQQEITEWRADQASQSSTGLRLEFYHSTLKIIAAQPLIGTGTGGFADAYAKQVHGSDKVKTHNPHNEFLHITAQLGLAGFITLIALLWTQWRSAALAATAQEQALTRALVLTMAVGCMVNSLLLDHAEGLFYAWLSGLLAGSVQYTPSGTAVSPHSTPA